MSETGDAGPVPAPALDRSALPSPYIQWGPISRRPPPVQGRRRDAKHRDGKSQTGKRIRSLKQENPRSRKDQNEEDQNHAGWKDGYRFQESQSECIGSLRVGVKKLRDFSRNAMTHLKKEARSDER